MQRTRWVKIAMVTAATLCVAACSLDTTPALERDPEARYVASLDHPAISPSGKYQLQVRTGRERTETGKFDYFEFEIWQILPGGKTTKVYTLNKRFSLYHRTICAWDQKDRVWIYSGDFGQNFLWAMDVAGRWQERPTGDLFAPGVLNRTMGVASFHIPYDGSESSSFTWLSMRVPRSAFAAGGDSQWITEYNLSDTRDRQKVLELFTKRRAEASRKYGCNNLELIGSLSELATAYEALGNYDEAGSALDSALALCGKIPDGLRPFPDRAELLLQLGRVCEKAGKLDRAERLCLEASDLERKATGPSSSYTISAITRLEAVYREEGKLQKAEQLYKQVRSAEQAMLK